MGCDHCIVVTNARVHDMRVLHHWIHARSPQVISCIFSSFPVLFHLISSFSIFFRWTHYDAKDEYCLGGYYRTNKIRKIINFSKSVFIKVSEPVTTYKTASAIFLPKGFRTFCKVLSILTENKIIQYICPYRSSK